MSSHVAVDPKPIRRVPVIVGPTASGKSAVALILARRTKGEILSADSRQVFRYMDIGTAKPTRDERRDVPHHFVDMLPPDASFSAGEFGAKGREVIDQIFARGGLPIVAGGSGLYIRSLIDGLFEGPGQVSSIRQMLERKANEGLVDDLLEELRAVDPESASRMTHHTPRRIIRALEVFHQTGKPLSVQQREQRVDVGFTPVLFGVGWEREELYRRIERRCDEMLSAGLLAEVDELERRGYGEDLNALKTVGYAEAFAYRRGRISYEEMVRLFRQNTRRYAKRQLTWFRADQRIRWLSMHSVGSPSEAAERIYMMFRDPDAEDPLFAFRA